MLNLSPSVKKLLGILGVLLLLGGAWGGRALFLVGNNVGYSPRQPIPFSHKLHAGDNKIPCLYCHTGADDSRHATIPGMNVCMNCHRVVKTDSPYIKQLTEAYNKGEPLQWVKVHDQPDFVNFNHKRHIKKGFDCAICHGEVDSMEKIKQVKTLNMGFCLDCHRKKDGPTSCWTCHK